MVSESNPNLPIFVQDAYGIDSQSSVTRLNGGLVNETLLVESQDRTLIIRKLAPILGSNTIRTISVVGEHLSSSGWEAPTIELTVDDQEYITDDSNRIWHGMKHIKSDCVLPLQPNAELAEHVGGLIGNWHAAVSSLRFSPESLPYFHDTDYIAKKLSNEAVLLPDAHSQELAALFLEDYYCQIIEPADKQQIIHGDPKLDNMLYRDGIPFTLIDFDCVMVDSIWTDIGDFLRSLSGKLLHTGDDPFNAVSNFISGYLDASGKDTSFDEASYYALQSTRRIASELGMRYLSDIVDGQNYFGWDKYHYNTRADALFGKAMTQFEILQITRNYLNEGVK
jgi:hypothetical protein